MQALSAALYKDLVMRKALSLTLINCSYFQKSSHLSRISGKGAKTVTAGGVKMKVAIFWDVKQYSSADRKQCFRETFCLQGIIFMELTSSIVSNS
jgi:hypothetical protein